VQAKKARHRAVLLHQDRRVDAAGRIVERHHQVEVVAKRADPAMLRAILEQQHAWHRAARALLAVLAASRRRLHQIS
jgi:hypothetical protein